MSQNAELDTMAGWMRLPGGVAKKARTWAEYSAWLSVGSFEDQRRVARDVIDGVEISTVFLSIDHAYPGGPGPVLWETMVFGGPHDMWQARYTSEAMALRGHARVLVALSAGLPPDGI